jgi:hypothetical protein
METAPPALETIRGLALARELVRRTGVRDPATLRRAADLVEVRATSELERAVAAGFRVEAAALEDERAGT